MSDICPHCNGSGVLLYAKGVHKCQVCKKSEGCYHRGNCKFPRDINIICAKCWDDKSTLKAWRGSEKALEKLKEKNDGRES